MGWDLLRTTTVSRIIVMDRKLPQHNSEEDEHKNNSEDSSSDTQVASRPKSFVSLNRIGEARIFSTNAVVGREFGSTVPSLMGVLGDRDDVWGKFFDRDAYAHALLGLQFRERLWRHG